MRVHARNACVNFAAVRILVFAHMKKSDLSNTKDGNSNTIKLVLVDNGKYKQDKSGDKENADKKRKRVIATEQPKRTKQKSDSK